MALSPEQLDELAALTRVSDSAARFADEAEGTIHVWAEDFGRVWLRVRAGLEPPDGLVFQTLDVDAVLLHVSLDVVPDELSIRLRPFPRGLVAATNRYGDGGGG